jgi:acetate kinase
MKILVVNAGSSSLKYQLLDMEMETLLARGLVERIGEAAGRVKHADNPGASNEAETVLDRSVADHNEALRLAVELMIADGNGVIRSKDDISGVGHRVVHGGERFSGSVLIDADVIEGIRENVPLAPLHNPAHLTCIAAAMELFPQARHAAVFDTAFHGTMPPQAFMYALPYELYESLHVRKYGFHGSSHRYVARRAAELLGKAPSQTNLVIAHLGNGSSVTAVEGGRSVDTSMGMTPAGGVIMGARSGNLDPGALIYLARNAGMDVDRLDRLLTRESGLTGICGASDMRDIHARIAEGDERAKLALEMAVYRTRQYIGAYFFTLGRVDAVVFTAGIGENDDVFREMCCERLENFGIKFDRDKNRNLRGGDHLLSAPDSPTAVYVISTNEELEIARETSRLLDPDAKRP